MASLWPWLAIAGLGALHGLNPATGWMLAAACGLRSRDRSQALRALWPIGLGHVASVGLVVLLVVGGLPVDRRLMQVAAGGLLLASVAFHLWPAVPGALRAPAGRVGLALWSFLMSSLHGAGLMLVPALLPLCLGSGGDSVSGGLATALAAMALHGASMLAITGLVARGVCQGFDSFGPRVRQWLRNWCRPSLH